MWVRVGVLRWLVLWVGWGGKGGRGIPDTAGMTKPMPHPIHPKPTHIRVQQPLDTAVMTEPQPLPLRIRRVLPLAPGAVGVGEGQAGEDAQAPEARQGVAVLGVGLGDVLEEVGFGGAGDQGVWVQGGVQARVGQGEV